MARIKFTGPGAKKPEIPKEPEVPRSSKSAKYPKKPKTTMTALRRSLRNTSVSDAGVAEKASVAAATGPVADTDVVMAEAAVADKGTGKGKTGGKGMFEPSSVDESVADNNLEGTISAASYTRMTAGAGVFTGADEGKSESFLSSPLLTSSADYSDDEEAPAAIAAAEAITSVEEGKSESPLSSSLLTSSAGGSAEAAAGTATATAAAEATVAGVPDAIAAEGMLESSLLSSMLTTTLQVTPLRLLRKLTVLLPLLTQLRVAPLMHSWSIKKVSQESFLPSLELTRILQVTPLSLMKELPLPLPPVKKVR